MSKTPPWGEGVPASNQQPVAKKIPPTPNFDNFDIYTPRFLAECLDPPKISHRICDPPKLTNISGSKQMFTTYFIPETPQK